MSAPTLTRPARYATGPQLVSVAYVGHDAQTHHEDFASWTDAADFAATYGVGACAEVTSSSKLYMEV